MVGSNPIIHEIFKGIIDDDVRRTLGDHTNQQYLFFLCVLLHYYCIISARKRNPLEIKDYVVNGYKTMTSIFRM